MALDANEETPRLLDPCKALKLAETPRQKRMYEELCKSKPADILLLLEVLTTKPRKTKEV